MLPKGWQRSTLGEIARISSRGTPDRAKPEYWGGEVPWVTTGEIQFNESPLLKGVGRISHDAMLKIVHGCYEEFDEQRRKAEASEADAVGIQDLEEVERLASKLGGRK